MISLLGCEKSAEKIKIKERALTGSDIDFLHPPLKPLNATLKGVKEGDMRMGERMLLASMGHSAQLGVYQSDITMKVTLQREKEIDIPKVIVLNTKKDKGASDGVLEPQRYNEINLNTKMTFTQGKGVDYALDHTNGAYGKEIRWIDRMLYVRHHREQFSKRKSMDQEHLQFREEPVTLLKTFVDGLQGRWKLIYIGARSVAGRSGVAYTIALSSEQFRTFEGSKSDVDSVSGEVVFDQERLVPLKISFQGTYRYLSQKHQKRVKAIFDYSREVKKSGGDITITVPEKILNTMRPPEEQDAEEKILSFKPGHSALEKLRAEDERHKRILNKSKGQKDDQKGNIPQKEKKGGK